MVCFPFLYAVGNVCMARWFASNQELLFLLFFVFCSFLFFSFSFFVCLFIYFCIVEDEQLVCVCIAWVWSGGCQAQLHYSVFITLNESEVNVSTEDIIMQLGDVCSERGGQCRWRALSLSTQIKVHGMCGRISHFSFNCFHCMRFETETVSSSYLRQIDWEKSTWWSLAVLFYRNAICPIFPTSSLASVRRGVASPAGVAVERRWHWSVGGSHITSVGNFFLSVSRWVIVSCKYIRLNLLYTCIVIATFNDFCINFVPNASL